MKPPKPPSHLKPLTRKWWTSVVLDYELEPHHVRILTLAGEAWDRGQEARAVIDSEGISYLDRFDQPKARPEISVERDSRLAFARLVRELSLDENPAEAVRIPRLVS